MSTFHGGLHLKYKKDATQDQPIIELPAPHKAVFPLQQNLGCPNDPLVKVGDEVIEGQKIADSTKFISAPIHASISGKVTKIERLPNACGFEVDSLVIESSSDAVIKTPFEDKRSLENLNAEDIRKIVREAGIVGLGGATFPTHVKLTPPADKPIDTLIINGCECEPYITSDHRIMLECAEAILFGAQAMAKAVGAKQIIIGVEDNKKDAIEILNSRVREPRSLPARPAGGFAGSLKIIPVKTKYPQGGEKQLIQTLLKREVPSGGLPLDVGVVVNNVATAVAVAEAIRSGQPLTSRILTVAGSGIKKPQNVKVRLGTAFSEVIEHCGGLTEDAAKVIMGGPMMGLAQSSLDVPVVKATSCILVLSRKEAKSYQEGDCIRCGRCIKACPIGLTPNFIADYAKLKNWEMTEEYNVADCIECGCCAYVCPSRIYLVQYFKAAKKELQLKKAVCK